MNLYIYIIFDGITLLHLRELHRPKNSGKKKSEKHVNPDKFQKYEPQAEKSRNLFMSGIYPRIWADIFLLVLNNEKQNDTRSSNKLFYPLKKN